MVKAAEEGRVELVAQFLDDGVPIDSVTKCVDCQALFISHRA